MSNNNNKTVPITYEFAELKCSEGIPRDLELTFPDLQTYRFGELKCGVSKIIGYKKTSNRKRKKAEKRARTLNNVLKIKNTKSGKLVSVYKNKRAKVKKLVFPPIWDVRQVNVSNLANLSVLDVTNVLFRPEPSEVKSMSEVDGMWIDLHKRSKL